MLTSFRPLARCLLPRALHLATQLPASTMAGDGEGARTAKKPKAGYVHSREAFMTAYSVLRDELLADRSLGSPPAYALDWFREVMDYNVPGGKLNRGMAVYDVLAAIKGSEALSEADAFKANALGWCIEWLQAFFLVADDIMDGSITRRGQPCWYKLNKVGLIACNDFILLECCIYSIIYRHFGDHTQLPAILKLFHEVTFQTASGQMLDVTTAPQGAADLTHYTLDTYVRIVTYKTAYYSFYLPVAAGMLIAGITDPGAFKTAETILVDMGRYFQIQDDYLDCYGDPEVIGKIGTDIEDSKCSWLVCTALETATPEQRDTIKAHYGRKDAASVATIKALYKELGLEDKFKAYETESYAQLTEAIDRQTALPKPVFTLLLKKIYKRSK